MSQSDIINDHLQKLQLLSKKKLPHEYKKTLLDNIDLVDMLLNVMINTNEYRTPVFVLARLLIREEDYIKAIDEQNKDFREKNKLLKRINKRYTETLAHYDLTLSRQLKIKKIIMS